jgi:rhodanese-related sulfurtransferase
MKPMKVKTITPTELARLRNDGRAVDLIDVRTPVEFREVHAEGARSVPLDTIDPIVIMEARNGSSREPLYLICRSGSRSLQAAERFIDAGYDIVASVEGGTLAWERAGLPVVRGAKAISLERQVRIASGSIVLIGTALGAFVHPAFLGLAAFVGAGLVFAGITDTCGMGMLLARMPWNRIGQTNACGA